MTPQPPKSATQPAPGKISLAHLPIELARQSFKTLLIANPNFFGNLSESNFSPVMNIQGDTAYESIGCVGYNPQLEQLRATINIKQASGYSGDLCTNGSQEYVRFYLSFDNGATWRDQGLRSVNVFDVPGPKPLEYAVTLPISPAEEFCFIQNLPLVRAILSWNSAPPAATPGFVPVWGNIVDAQIQIDGFDFIILNTLLSEAKVKLHEEIAESVNLQQQVAAAPAKALTAAELHKLYKGTSVPQHRYLANLLNASASAPTVATTLNFGGISEIDLSDVVNSFINTNGDTAYEQLDCIGLDPNLSQLAGVLEIKQSSGYAGGPCTGGSTEYVAFWVDWGSGLQYVGTTSVGVHDFSTIPAGGLRYNVFLPVNLLSHAQPCSSPQTAKVHAVLSWNTPPSTTNPNAPVVWGNSLDGLILIPPGEQIGNGQQVPVLSAVGDVATDFIAGDGLITSATTVTTGAYYADAPFGGRITLAGQISNPAPGLKYRIMKAPHGSGIFTPVVNEPAGLTLQISTFSGGGWTEGPQTFHSDADGYYPYQDYSIDHSVQDHLLGVWYSTAADTGFAYDLRVDLNADAFLRRVRPGGSGGYNHGHFLGNRNRFRFLQLYDLATRTGEWRVTHAARRGLDSTGRHNCRPGRLRVLLHRHNGHGSLRVLADAWSMGPDQRGQRRNQQLQPGFGRLLPSSWQLAAPMGPSPNVNGPRKTAGSVHNHWSNQASHVNPSPNLDFYPLCPRGLAGYAPVGPGGRPMGPGCADPQEVG